MKKRYTDEQVIAALLQATAPPGVDLLQHGNDLGLGELRLLLYNLLAGKRCQKVLLIRCLPTGDAYGIKDSENPSER